MVGILGVHADICYVAWAAVPLYYHWRWFTPVMNLERERFE